MKRIRVIVSLMTRENDYQLEQAASAQESAASLGLDAQVIFGDNDSITQGTQLLKIIQSDPSRPDGIICEPVGGPCLPQVARAAVQAGIPWVLLNREADYIAELRRNVPRLPIFSIGSDQKEVGRLQGQQLGALVRNGGGVLHIQGPSDNTTAKDRTTGLQATLPHHIPVTTLRGQWTEESAQRSVESWLRLNTSQKVSISAVAGQNDAMAMGARKAFSSLDNNADRDRWLRVPYVGCDGVTKTGQSWVRTGLLAATVIIPATAGRAISTLHQALHSDTRPPERIYTTPESFPPLAQLH
ncbi:MAG: substrate-binding domain-containing protein [Acidobacteria bacterium]|nr:substrate-binding domain-containing protein [Acidobacteriota bacterium]